MHFWQMQMHFRYVILPNDKTIQYLCIYNLINCYSKQKYELYLKAYKVIIIVYTFSENRELAIKWIFFY